MKATLDRFKLGNILEGENTREKLAAPAIAARRR